MSLSQARSGKFSLGIFHDAQVRAGVYLWLVIAGLCVLLANMVGVGA
ncbi:MAG: hypothetical protein HOO67_07000 [Candidatus Peribacteraceae bacterium]|nr:hypothetical protein [Candidatus Peribacteraceae bacterium]